MRTPTGIYSQKLHGSCSGFAHDAGQVCHLLGEWEWHHARQVPHVGWTITIKLPLLRPGSDFIPISVINISKMVHFINAPPHMHPRSNMRNEMQIYVWVESSYKNVLIKILRISSRLADLLVFCLCQSRKRNWKMVQRLRYTNNFS